MKQATIFPKLFIGSAANNFKYYLKKHNYNYEINYIADREDLLNFIETFSHYKDYTLPVIIDDISYLSSRDQSLLLKFMDDANLNIILLASRDNILNTIISRVKEFRKFYVYDKGNRAGFIKASKAREMLINDSVDNMENISIDDKISLLSKYNPVLFYDDTLVSKHNNSEKKKLLNLIEYSNE
jgi:hypothetical protein